MPKLFLDVDDTLVKWQRIDQTEEPDGKYLGDPYVLNFELFSDAMCFAAFHKYDIVVWSGGGIQYAQMWGEKCLHHQPFTVHYKDMRVPQFPDVVVDDDDVRPRDKRVRVVKDLRTCPICNPILTR